jgi:hypothetical protein
MHIAAILTQAAMARAAGGTGAPVIPIDPTNQEPQQRGITLEVWEVFRAFYVALDGALADDTNWVPPTGGSSGPAIPPKIIAALSSPAVLAALAAAISGNPALGVLPGIIKDIGLVLPAIAATPVVPVPAPGAAPATTTTGS